jgi:1,4-alpha-glucan branching enzyme
VRFAAGLAAGVAFAAGLGLGLFAGWRMRGESYRLAREEMRSRVLPPGEMIDASAMTLRPVSFMLVAPTASRVALVGEFNDWDASATPMTRASGGSWHVALPLASGRHVYAFVVDGNAWVADPRAPLAPERWFGAQNSVLLVGERRQ